MQTAQMQNSKLRSGFAGGKLTGRRGLAGSALRFHASFRTTAARKNGLNIRAEKVGGILACLDARRRRPRRPQTHTHFPFFVIAGGWH